MELASTTLLEGSSVNLQVEHQEVILNMDLANSASHSVAQLTLVDQVLGVAAAIKDAAIAAKGLTSTHHTGPTMPHPTVNNLKARPEKVHHTPTRTTVHTTAQDAMDDAGVGEALDTIEAPLPSPCPALEASTYQHSLSR